MTFRDTYISKISLLQHKKIYISLSIYSDSISGSALKLSSEESTDSTASIYIETAIVSGKTTFVDYYILPLGKNNDINEIYNKYIEARKDYSVEKS